MLNLIKYMRRLESKLTFVIHQLAVMKELETLMALVELKVLMKMLKMKHQKKELNMIESKLVSTLVTTVIHFKELKTI